jgi:hypothetical protein
VAETEYLPRCKNASMREAPGVHADGWVPPALKINYDLVRGGTRERLMHHGETD